MLGWEISVGSVGFFVCGVVRGHGLVLVGGERGRGRGGGGGFEVDGDESEVSIGG